MRINSPFSYAMDRTTANELSKRLDDLEVRIGLTAEDRNTTSLKDGTMLLYKQLENLYEKRPELKALDGLAREFNLLNTQRDTEPVGVDLSAEDQQKLLLLKYPQIKSAYDNLIELGNMDVARIINNIASLLDKTHSLGDDRNKLLSREKQIEQLTSEFHWLVMENMIVLERFAELTRKQDQFWAGVEDEMKNLTAYLSNYEQKNQNKY